MIWYLVYCFQLFTLCLCQGPGTEQEPDAVLNFDSSIFVCKDDVSSAFVDASSIETKRFNESVACLFGTFELFAKIDTDTAVEIVVMKIAGGRAETVFSLMLCEICKEIEDPDSPIRSYMESIDFPLACPIEPGKYTVSDLVADTKDLPINSMNSGPYQAKVTVFRDGDGSCNNMDFVACLTLNFDIEPL